MFSVSQIKRGFIIAAISVLPTIQIACYSPKAGVLVCKYSVKSLPMPKGAYWQIFYKKSNPNIIFLSEKGAWGPGIMVNILTGEQEDIADKRSKREDINNQQRKGESFDDWVKRTWNPPIADDTFDGFGCMESSKDYFTTKYSGHSEKRSGLATKGFPFSTGIRQTEEYYFTGDLIISVRGEEVIRQHLENFPSSPMRFRAWEALEVGLIVYRDERPDGTGTVHILKLTPMGRQDDQGLKPTDEVRGVVGPVRPSVAKESK